MLRRLLARPEAALFVLVFACYAYFYQAGGWNQNSRFDLTRALVEHGTVRIDPYQANTGDKSARDGHFYCDKAPGVSWLAVPAWAAVYVAAGAPERASPGTLATGAYLATITAVGLPSAIAVVFLFGLLVNLGLSRPWATGLTLAYALGTLAWPYSTLLYGHQVVAALHLIAFAMLVAMRRGATAVTPWRFAVVGALLGSGIAVEYTAALLGLPLGLYALATLRPRLPTLGAGVLGGLVPIAALMLYHHVAFGGPLTLPYEFSTQPHRHQGWFMGLGKPDFDVLRQLLVSERRGLFYSAPWLAVAAAGLAPMAWRRETRAEALVGVTALFAFLWLDSSLVDWDGGWALGPRYLVPMLPFVAIGAVGLVHLLERASQAWLRRSVAIAATALVALSIYLMLAGTAVRPEVPVMVRRPFGDFLLPRFAAGQLAVSTQSIDRIGENPRATHPEAWNLGHRLGLGGKATLAPLALVVAGAAAWLVLRLRRDADVRPS